MVKLLTGRDLGQILYRAAHDPTVVICADAYEYLIEDMAKLVAKHFGGEVVCVGQDPQDSNNVIATFVLNENVPESGGIYRDYDWNVRRYCGHEVEL